MQSSSITLDLGEVFSSFLDIVDLRWEEYTRDMLSKVLVPVRSNKNQCALINLWWFSTLETRYIGKTHRCEAIPWAGRWRGNRSGPCTNEWWENYSVCGDRHDLSICLRQSKTRRLYCFVHGYLIRGPYLLMPCQLYEQTRSKTHWYNVFPSNRLKQRNSNPKGYLRTFCYGIYFVSLHCLSRDSRA